MIKQAFEECIKMQRSLLMGQLYFDEVFCGILLTVPLNLCSKGSERAAHKLSRCLSFSTVFSNKMEHFPPTALANRALAF